jgi:DnaJ-class molecular chaperone
MTLDRVFKSAYVDEPAKLIDELTAKVRCPSCDGSGHWGMDECSLCQGEGAIPREMASYEAQSHGY